MRKNTLENVSFIASPLFLSLNGFPEFCTHVVVEAVKTQLERGE